MSRWPALARRAWRPNPILADVTLALVLAGLSLLTVETGRQAADPRPETDTELLIQPAQIRPGDSVEITVRKGGKPFQVANVEPLLTIQNVTTGEWRTYIARPTAEPGVYRIPAVDPGRGVYSYSVLYGPFERAGVRGGAPPAPDPESAPSESDGFSGWPIGLTLLATLPIAMRRRYPLPVLAVTLPAALAMDVFYENFQFAGALVAVYTVAAYVGRPGSIGVGVGTALALTVTQFEDNGGLVENAAIYVIFGAAWIAGDRIGARRTYLRELEGRAARHDEEREEDARRAAAAEQARIARELHDIIAHNVSVMTVQAAAAGDVFETHPARAREALGSIESTGREALTELRRLLGSVRADDGASVFAPQPGLDRIGALIEQVRAAGLPVELTTEGVARELPIGLDLSAYRIVQEALTNILKHAQASKADITLRYGDESLEISVVDDGRGPPVGGAETGHGLIGMRERAALVGGELRVGLAPGGGFLVEAHLPLAERAAI